MSSEFFDEEAAIRDLKVRLRNIRDTVAPLIKNDMLEPGCVPKHIREEIVQIYDEHGGIDLLANLTKLTFNAINNWHRRWQYNPYIFRTTNEYKPRKSNTLIRKVLNPSEAPEKITKSQQVILKGSTVTEKVRNIITGKQEHMVKNIKEMIENKIKLGGQMDEDIAGEVRNLFCEIGDAREVAIVLGISQELVEEWIECITLDDL